MMTNTQADAFLIAMSDQQILRVCNRFNRISSAFDNIRDALAQAVADEVTAIETDMPPALAGTEQLQ
jgi:hypothetical protein